MVKKSDKYSGMNDMFLMQQIDEKTAIFEAAKKKLEKELEDAQKNISNTDSGLSAIEARNERNAIKSEILLLEQQYNREIAELKSKSK